MNLTSKTIDTLRQGRIVGAELPAPRTNFRAFVLVIPQVPDPPESSKDPNPFHRGNRLPRNEGGLIGLKDPSLLIGYEIRYLEHHSKYTDEEWGMDSDYVLDDITTRIKRIYVKREDEIKGALATWLNDLSQLQEPDDFDSSLANSIIDYYLNRETERPHLWL